MNNKGRQNKTRHTIIPLQYSGNTGERRKVVLLVAECPHTDASLSENNELEIYNKMQNPLKAVR